VRCPGGRRGEKNANAASDDDAAAAADDDDNDDNDDDDGRKRGAAMVAAPTIAAPRRVVVRRRIGGGRGSLFFFLLSPLKNEFRGSARHEGKARGGYCFLRRIRHVENQGENLPPIVEICTHTFSKPTAKLGKIRDCTSHIFGKRGLFVPFFPARQFFTYVEVYLCPLIPNYVLFLENKGTNSPPKTNTAQTYVQSRLMSLNVPPRHNDNNTKTLNVI
jgi:hypothetical protein